MAAGGITRIVTIQRSLRELGRIRLGEKGAKGEPRKLSTFRLTSASQEYVAAAAEAYGGTVTPWESPRGGEWQTTIESPTLDVLVPPGDAVSQAFELWTGGGCQRRCDGNTQETGEACACPADVDERSALAAKGQACKPTTRLWVILPRLPDLGRWRLESHGYYAAVELAGMAEIASMATSQGIMLPARLRIDQRTRKIPGQPMRQYIVPVLELPETNFGQLVAGGFIRTTAPALEAGDQPALPPGPSQPRLTAPKPARAPRPELGAPPALPAEANFDRGGEAPFGGGAPAPSFPGSDATTAPQDEAGPVEPVGETSTVASAVSSDLTGYALFKARVTQADPKPTEADVRKAAKKHERDIPDIAMRQIRDWPLTDGAWMALGDALNLPAL